MSKTRTSNGKKGGLLEGKPHYDKDGNSLGGIKAVVTDAGGKPVELEGGEVIINKEASKKYWKELSKINQSAGNGVPILPPDGAVTDEDPEEFSDGGNIIEFNPNHLPNKWITEYAKQIKRDHPEIWKKGGNIFGNEAFVNLVRVRERGHWLDSEEWMYIKWRSYVARHKKDFRIEGVVAMLKWCDKVEKGWGYMKTLIEKEIANLERKKKPSAFKQAIKEKSLFKDGGKVSKTNDSCQVLDKDGNPAIDDKSLRKMEKCIMKLTQTKDLNLNANGKYKLARRKLHKKIIDEFKKNAVCITKGQPIAILMGGSPASGKSSFLRKYRPFLLQEEILKVDADEIRAKLPEYKGYNATQTHQETKDIVTTLISDRNIGVPCDFDLIYDGTMNNVRSYKPLIELLRSRNYKIFIVYMDKVPKEVIMQRMKDRYLKTGRFVPAEVVDDFFKKGTSAFEELKPLVDGYLVIDGSNQDYDIIEKGGMQLPEDRAYSKLGQKISAEELEKIEYKRGGNLDKIDSVELDIPLLIRVLEFAREDIKSDPELHHVVERLIEIRDKGVLTMKDYDFIADLKKKEKFSEIERKYAKGGAVLVAPNGKPSNLTPEQHKLVRTTAFKKCFGYWENDPENSSKIIDKNGEPLLVYHGTNQDFSTFDLKTSGKRFNEEHNTNGDSGDYGMWGVGFYFSPIKKFSQHYGSKVIKLFLNIRNPFVRDPNITGTDSEFQPVRGKEASLKLREEILSKGYDGVIHIERSQKEPAPIMQIVSFYPNQIKLADGTNTTFDPNNDDIRFENGGEITNYTEFYDNLEIKDGSMYIGQKFSDVFPFLRRRKTPNDFRIMVNQYYGVLDRLSKDNYSSPTQKQRDLNKLWRKRDIEHKKYLSRFYLDGIGTIIEFRDSNYNDSNPDVKFETGGIIDEDAQQYIDIVSMNPTLEKYQKYKDILKEKYNIDFDSIYKDNEYIETANLDDIKSPTDFLDFYNWLKYAKIISTMRGFVKMDDYSFGFKHDLTDAVWKELSEKLDFNVKKVEYIETSSNGGDIARAMGDTIFYTDHADLYYLFHETAHIYDFQNQDKISKIVHSPAYSPTEYGTMNGGEAFAENFAIYFINPTALKKWNQEVYETMDKTINEKYKKELNRLASEYIGNKTQFENGGKIQFTSTKSVSINVGDDLYKFQYQRGERGDTDKPVWFAKLVSINEKPAEGRLCFEPFHHAIIEGFSLKEVENLVFECLKENELWIMLEDEYGNEKEVIHVDFKYDPNTDSLFYKQGGRTTAQTPAPSKERIYGSEKNKPRSSKDSSSAESIKFEEKTLISIENKLKEHNESHPEVKVNLATAKAVVRRGMGAYSKSHRPTISGGKPNSRVAWGLARLNAFLYKAVHGESKSGKYSQDNDLLDELSIAHDKFKNGGEIETKQKQLEIINSSNPAPNNYNTWIRTAEDIKTAEEVFSTAFEEGAMYPDFQTDDMSEALKSGYVTIYSSYPIKEGVFVTPSKMNALDYAGGNSGKVFSKKVQLKDIAWIDESEGQYAPTESFKTGGEIPKKKKNGNCYEKAGKMILYANTKPYTKIDYIGKPYLVHAQVTGQGAIEGVKYGHAWIEDDAFVYDYSNKRKLKVPKALYYEIGQIIEQQPIHFKYTFEQARRKMNEIGHYGSWDLITESGL
jgi:predicted ABC-type ATPase